MVEDSIVKEQLCLPQMGFEQKLLIFNMEVEMTRNVGAAQTSK